METLALGTRISQDIVDGREWLLVIIIHQMRWTSLWLTGCEH